MLLLASLTQLCGLVARACAHSHSHSEIKQSKGDAKERSMCLVEGDRTVEFHVDDKVSQALTCPYVDLPSFIACLIRLGRFLLAASISSWQFPS